MWIHNVFSVVLDLPQSCVENLSPRVTSKQHSIYNQEKPAQPLLTLILMFWSSQHPLVELPLLFPRGFWPFGSGLWIPPHDYHFYPGLWLDKDSLHPLSVTTQSKEIALHFIFLGCEHLGSTGRTELLVQLCPTSYRDKSWREEAECTINLFLSFPHQVKNCPRQIYPLGDRWSFE